VLDVEAMTADISEHAPAGRITIACQDDESNPFPAWIASLDAGGIVRVMVPRELPEGTRIQVHSGPEYSAPATVLYSVGSNDRHWATIQMHREDRRRQPRIVVDTDARMILQHAGASSAVNARVTDVSKSGLGLMTDQIVASDTPLKIILDGAIIFAEARHCQEVCGSAPSYKVGVEIQTVILSGEAEPDWQHTPKELWGSLAEAVRAFQGQS
jgi:hypothetical protein